MYARPFYHALMRVVPTQASTSERVEWRVPTDRGRLLTPTQVAADLFNGTVSAAWVRRTVPGKVVLGHSTVRYYEQDVRAWIEQQRQPS